jgi:hypothetical protein
MEKISKTDLYQRGIPLLAFLPILALLSEQTAGGALAAGHRREDSDLAPFPPKALGIQGDRFGMTQTQG